MVRMDSSQGRLPPLFLRDIDVSGAAQELKKIAPETIATKLVLT
jgi:hypothetical protein